MKTIFRFASLLSAAVMLFASCEGPVDGPVTPPNDEPDVPETEGTLTLEVDKLIIQSNGTDASTLTVKFNGKTLTEDIVVFDGDKWYKDPDDLKIKEELRKRILNKK